METGDLAPGCIRCGASHACTELQIIDLLTEIRDNQRAQMQRPESGAPHPTAAEGAALNVVQEVAKELEAAAVALDNAAAQLREDGKGFRASQAKQAAGRAHAYARELING